MDGKYLQGRWEMIISIGLKSHKKGRGDKRSYPSAKVKRQLFAAQDQCQFCRATENLQIDHKVPRERGGQTMLENLQLLCSSCNIEKRGICKKCVLTTCDGCPYAYPELNSGRMVLLVDQDLINQIDKLSQEAGVQPTKYVGDILTEHLRHNSAE